MELAAIIIASISAVFSLGSLGVSFLTFRRDRPHLKVSLHYSASLYEPAVMGVDVTNVGKRPTTIVEAGFKADADLKITIPKNKAAGNKSSEVPVRKNIYLSREPVLLNPGEIKKFRLILDKWPDIMIHADFPLRAYAVSSHGTTCWGASRPILRQLIKLKWTPPKNTPPELIKLLPEELKPLPIYPKWKFWKPKSLR